MALPPFFLDGDPAVVVTQQEEEEEADVGDGLERLAASMRVLARQSPHMANEPGTQHRRALLETAAESALEAGRAQRRWGRQANEAAHALVQRLPAPLRRLVLATIRRKRVGAVCVFEAYEGMLALRQDMRAPQHREFYLRLNETLFFMDAQEDLRACIRAHRIARQAQVLSHTLLLGCGACGFGLRSSPPHIY
jgi:hypothetical protein